MSTEKLERAVREARLALISLDHALAEISQELSGVSVEDDGEVHPVDVLSRRIGSLGLSARSENCLINDRLIYIGDLVQRSEQELLRTPNLGRVSLKEIKDVLGRMGLSLGMRLPRWLPPDVDLKAIKETVSAYAIS